MHQSTDGNRLQKVLAAAGYGSRRACEVLIAQGRVRVNGEVAVLGRRVDAERDIVLVDNAIVAIKTGLVHYLLNKPVDVVTTMHDPEGRTTVADLVPDEPRVFPVGRLDYATEGLLIMTNDGELSHRLTHPSFGVDKEYLVHVEKAPSSSAVNRLRRGVELDDGKTAPAEVGVVGDRLLRITIHEGRNRQIRRMCEAVQCPVVRLARVRIGPIRDSWLRPGQWRPLSQDEVRRLAESVIER